MLPTPAVSTPLCLSPPFPSRTCNSRISYLSRIPSPAAALCQPQYFSLYSACPLRCSPYRGRILQTHSSPNASSSSSVETADYTEEPTTNVKFQRSLSLPGCSGLLSLLGTVDYKVNSASSESGLTLIFGSEITSVYREKVFAIIGVKVYAAGLYVNLSVLSQLNGWKGKSAAEVQESPSLFNSIFQSSSEKSLQIVLVRDVDGKTFWDALDDAISPRIKAPTSVDQSALSTFRSIFDGRPLKKGTFIFLTWLGPSKMLVSISTNGIPTSADAELESGNVAFALFDVFFGNTPVSPSLRDSVSKGLSTILK